jgi:hypothetical protein
MNPSNTTNSLSRRFLRIAGIAALAGAIGIPDWDSKSTFGKSLADTAGEGQDAYDAFVQGSKARLKETYGIVILAGPEKGQNEYLGNPPSLDAYKKTLQILEERLSDYPPEMIRAVGEGRGLEIRAIDEPTQPMEKGPQNPNGEKRIRIAGNALPLQEGKPAQLILATNEDESSQRRSIDHELNHRFAEKFQTWGQRRVMWKGFHSEIMAENPYHPERIQMNPNTPPSEAYFLNMLASTSAEEDQAVTAEWMMTPLLHYEFVERLNGEKGKERDALSRKYGETMRNYAAWSGGRINEQFWRKKLKQGKEEWGKR